MDTVENTELQLQLWDDKTRAYVPAPSDAVRTRSWRLVDPAKNWALKTPKHRKYRKAPSQGYSRSIETVRSQYMQWAKDAGLKTITDWKHCGPAPGFAYTRLVDKDLYFAVTVEDCA